MNPRVAQLTAAIDKCSWVLLAGRRSGQNHLLRLVAEMEELMCRRLLYTEIDDNTMPKVPRTLVEKLHAEVQNHVVLSDPLCAFREQQSGRCAAAVPNRRSVGVPTVIAIDELAGWKPGKSFIGLLDASKKV